MKKNRWLFLLFLLSYLIVAFVPLTVATSLYYNDLSSHVQAAFVTEELNHLRGAIAMLDSNLSIIANLPYQLAENREVLDYKNNPETLGKNYVIATLKQIIGGNELIEDIYLYFRQPQTFISAYTNSFDVETMRIFGSIRGISYSDITYDALLEVLTNGAQAQVWPARQVHVGSQNLPIITFFDTLPKDNRFAYAGMLTLVNANYLNQLLTISPESSYILLDTDNQVVMQQLAFPWAEGLLPASMEGALSGSDEAAIAGEPYIRTWYRSAVSGWKLVAYTPSNFSEHIASVRNKTLLFFTGVSFVLALLIALFMKKTYKPVSHLYLAASDIVKTDEKRPTRQLRQIENTLYELNTRNIELQERVLEADTHARDYFIRELIFMDGAGDRQALAERAAAYKINLNHRSFQIFLMHYKDPIKMREKLRELPALFGRAFVCATVEDIYGQLILILGGPSASAGSLAPEGPLLAAEAEIIAAGTPVDDVARWSDSYNSALQISDWALLHQDERIIYTAQAVPAYTVAKDPWLLLQTFATVIHQNNLEKIRKTERDMTDYIVRSASCILEARMIVCHALSIIREKLTDDAAQVEKDIRSVYFGRAEGSAAKMCAKLHRATELLCRQMEQKLLDRENGLMQLALAYIEQHIGSQELSLASVAEHVGLSPSRFSFLFHQAMALNYKTYVDHLRADIAKNLLITTDLDIHQIALAVGYNSSYSFSRFFKKEVGIAPKEFRDIHHP